MATYHYEAMDQFGQDALTKIKNLGQFPTRIRAKERATIPILVAAEDEPSRGLRLAVTWGPVLAFLACVGLFLIPLSYMWNHDDLTTLQIIKANWKSTLGGTVIFMLLSVWVKLRKWVENGCP